VTATVATLTALAGFPVEVEVIRRGASTPASGGFVTGRQLRSSVSRESMRAETRRWTVQFKNLSLAEKDAVLAARRTALGGVHPVAWEPPPPDDGATIPVRFLGDVLTVQFQRSTHCYTITAELEEAI
jgi:hypothetical protein